MFYNTIVFHVTPFLLFIFFILPTRSGMRRCTQKSGTWIIFRIYIKLHILVFTCVECMYFFFFSVSQLQASHF